MNRQRDCNLKISILNINVHSITSNGSLNIGKSLIVREKEDKSEKKQGIHAEGLSGKTSGESGNEKEE
ncbi:MAG TPA: hypothetical protein VFK33_15540 [Bacillales bacterium]|nr:hypothetical protein [Bacillales bacterium]